MDENIKKTTERRDKWDDYADKVNTGTSSKIATFRITANHTLNLLNKTSGDVLDIGCGFGEIDILLAQKTRFKITACDISKRCVSRARRKIKEAGLERKIKAEIADVYSLPYKDNSFDVVVSFGYTSAATYFGAQGEVARVLKTGGMLVCDFINPFCLYRIAKLPKRAMRMIRPKNNVYNTATMSGISNHFRKQGFEPIAFRLFNCYPPVNVFPAGAMVFFDKTIGAMLNKILGRVRIVCFQKK